MCSQKCEYSGFIDEHKISGHRLHVSVVLYTLTTTISDCELISVQHEATFWWLQCINEADCRL